jgi:hypothetical protein
MIGAHFSGRAHRVQSIFGHMGGSAFPIQIAEVLCSLNSAPSRDVATSLNPTLHFLVGDVNRLPIAELAGARSIFATLEAAISEHERGRETSLEFKRPGPSPWSHAQAWAQSAVDRPQGAPLPPYAAEYVPPDAEAGVSFAIGIALGRFGNEREGVLDVPAATALPSGILFVGPSDAYPDSLTHPSVAPVLAAWEAFAPTSGKKPALRDWLRWARKSGKGDKKEEDFFVYHRRLYETRPIYLPLSSEKASFVAWVNIHRFTDETLRTLLADHLAPVLRQLDGEIADANAARSSSDKETAIAAGKAYDAAARLRIELTGFIASVSECSERGPRPVGDDCPPREVDAAFSVDLDDGVVVNCAALWPLLAPQWSDPKKWWRQLCRAEPGSDYDWSHLAKRYFPTRVDAMCRRDPSIAVAHGCFWKCHPAKAFGWELRLQEEIRAGFTIDEPGSDEARATYLNEHAAEAETAREKERVRRERRAARAEADEETDGTDEETDGGDDGDSARETGESDGP